MDRRRFLAMLGKVGLCALVAPYSSKRDSAIVEQLCCPERYREEFLAIWEQWKDTTRPEGPLWWTCTVFGEYVYPGWTYTKFEREMLEDQRTARQESG